MLIINNSIYLLIILNYNWYNKGAVSGWMPAKIKKGLPKFERQPFDK